MREKYTGGREDLKWNAMGRDCWALHSHQHVRDGIYPNMVCKQILRWSRKEFIAAEEHQLRQFFYVTALLNNLVFLFVFPLTLQF